MPKSAKNFSIDDIEWAELIKTIKEKHESADKVITDSNTKIIRFLVGFYMEVNNNEKTNVDSRPLVPTVFPNK